MAPRSLVGAPIKRKEDPRLITGSSISVDDLQLPGMAHLAIVRSRYAHAAINRGDAAAALRMPGVIAVLTARELAPLVTGNYPVETYTGPSERPEQQEAVSCLEARWFCGGG